VQILKVRIMKDFIQNEMIRKVFFIVLAVLCLTPLISSPIALALGFALAVFIGNPFEKRLHH